MKTPLPALLLARIVMSGALLRSQYTAVALLIRPLDDIVRLLRAFDDISRSYDVISPVAKYTGSHAAPTPLSGTVPELSH